MIRSIIISPDRELAAHLETGLKQLGEIGVFRTLNAYPNSADLARLLRVHAPDVVFMSFESMDPAAEIVRFLDKEAEGVQILAIHPNCDAAVLRDVMRLGVREFIAEPFERQALTESLRHAAELLERKPPSYRTTAQVFSFLPSKAGVGTSTLALNVSGALSRHAGSRVLLSDFDLNSGMMRFFLKLQNEFSVVEAVEHSNEMDENLWPQLVTTLGNLDVLHAGRINPSLRIEATQIRNLIQFMRRNYQALCFDLSGNLERYSIEIMMESKRVLLVCTPEIPSLHLAREKLQFLRSLDLDSRVMVVLNRSSKKPLFSKAQVQEIIGAPVFATMPNDYRGVNDAVAAASFVDKSSELGIHYAHFAESLTGQPSPKPVETKKKFLEFFSVSNSTALQRR